MSSSQKGLTLVELLVVVVIIGALAAIAIPRFATTKEKAAVAAMKSDLRNLAAAQLRHFGDFRVYAAPADGDNANLGTRILDASGNVIWQPTSGVRVFGTGATTTADSSGWTASVSSVGTVQRCAMFVGTPAAAAILWSAKSQQEGEPTCY